MWVSRRLFDIVTLDNKEQQKQIYTLATANTRLSTENIEARTQKSKDDITIDWLRSRVNALEKERTVLLMKAAGIALPTPEITSVGPRAFESPKYDMGISFEDSGDEESARLGIQHDEEGNLVYTK